MREPTRKKKDDSRRLKSNGVHLDLHIAHGREDGRSSDDVVLEILTRVGTADVGALFRCITACKRWRRLVANPSFLRRLWPPHGGARRTSSILGFFVELRPHHGGDVWVWPTVPSVGRPSPVFIPSPRSAMASRRGSLESLVQGAAADPSDRVVPLASCNGLLLVRLIPWHQDPLDYDMSVLRLAVCDLLVGTCDLLPALVNPDYVCFSTKISYAILTGDEDYCSNAQWRQPLLGSGYSAFFKVLVVVLGRQLCKLYTFSSTESTTRWSEAASPCSHLVGDPHPLMEFGPSSAIVWRGTVRWFIWSMTGDYILSMSIQTGQLSLSSTNTSIPFTYNNTGFYHTPLLSVAAEGLMSLLYLHRRSLRGEIWTRQNDDEKTSKDANNANRGWIFSSMIKLELPEGKKQDTTSSYDWWLAEKSGTLLVKDVLKNVYVVDLETAVMEEVTDSFLGVLGNIYTNIVPFEMDWPAYFASRLGSE